MNKTTKTKKKAGRPKIEIDWEKVEGLCGLHCTGEEIAGQMGFSYDTLERAIRREYDQNFAEYYKRHSSKGNISLRRIQHITALGRPAKYDSRGNLIEKELAPNPTMQIWLGKQYLGQKELSNDSESITRDLQEMMINISKSIKNAE